MDDRQKQKVLEQVFSPYRAAADGFFNPFGAGDANGRAVLDFISQGFSEARDRSRARSANLLVAGPLWTLPGGDLQLAVGAQARRETFETRTTAFGSTAAPVTTVTPEQGRSIRAVFAEVRAPLVGPDNARPGLRRVHLFVNGRPFRSPALVRAAARRAG